MKLQHEQIEAFIELLREHHSKDAKGYFSERRVRLLIEKEIDNPKTLILTNKSVSALLILMVMPSHFTTQQNLQEISFYSRTTGSGFRLLKEAQPWINSWGDGLLYKAFASSGTKETNKMLERFGMKQIGVVFDMGGL